MAVLRAQRRLMRRDFGLPRRAGRAAGGLLSRIRPPRLAGDGGEAAPGAGRGGHKRRRRWRRARQRVSRSALACGESTVCLRRMPAAEADTSRHMPAVIFGSRWNLALVPHAIAVNASCHDVVRPVRTAVRSSLQMFGGALEAERKPCGQTMPLRKDDEVRVPHGKAAVPAPEALPPSSPIAIPSEGRRAHACRYRFTALTLPAVRLPSTMARPFQTDC